MGLMDPIAGITLERYAELCAKMADTNNDESREVAVAEAEGTPGAVWLEAKKGWSDRMMDDAKKTGELARAFMPHYQGWQSKLRGGKEPIDLEGYAVIAAELAFMKGPDGNQVDQVSHLATKGMTLTKWGEISGYWVPKVNDPADPSAGTFRVLMQRESDRIFGIVRDASGSVVSNATWDKNNPEAAAEAKREKEEAAREEETAKTVHTEPDDLMGMVTKFFKSIFG